MIHPAPTSRIDPALARGELSELLPAAAGKPQRVVLTFPNTSYRMQLVAAAPVTGAVGKRIVGTIRADARRVDIVETGGAYVEPVFGHPRRVQGRVIAVNESARRIVVDAAVPIHCRLTDQRQDVSMFPIGEMVSFDVMDGATFEVKPG